MGRFRERGGKKLKLRFMFLMVCFYRCSPNPALKFNILKNLQLLFSKLFLTDTLAFKNNLNLLAIARCFILPINFEIILYNYFLPPPT